MIKKYLYILFLLPLLAVSQKTITFYTPFEPNSTTWWNPSPGANQWENDPGEGTIRTTETSGAAITTGRSGEVGDIALWMGQHSLDGDRSELFRDRVIHTYEPTYVGYSIWIDERLPTSRAYSQMRNMKLASDPAPPDGHAAKNPYMLRQHSNSEKAYFQLLTDPTLAEVVPPPNGASNGAQDWPRDGNGFDLPSNQWNDIVIYWDALNYTNDNTLKIWVNGVLIVDHFGVTNYRYMSTGLPVSGDLKHNIGVYWADLGPSGEAYYDEYKVCEGAGCTYADVDPAPITGSLIVDEGFEGTLGDCCDGTGTVFDDLQGATPVLVGSAREGSQAVKLEGVGGDRNELTVEESAGWLQWGEEYWHGVAVKVVDPADGFKIILQHHAIDNSGNFVVSAGVNSFTLRTNGGNFDFLTSTDPTHVNDSPGNTGAIGDTELAASAPYTLNQWHDIVLHFYLAGDNTGYFEIWLDGVKIADIQNNPTVYLYDAGGGLKTPTDYGKIGVYYGSPNTSGNIHYDAYRIWEGNGGTYEDVSPDGNSPVGSAQKEYWLSEWQTAWTNNDSLYRFNQAESGFINADEYDQDMYYSGWAASALLDVWRSTGETTYLNQLLDITYIWKNKSVLIEEIDAGQYYGWPAYNTSAAPGNESNPAGLALWESYFWRYVATALRNMKTDAALLTSSHGSPGSVTWTGTTYQNVYDDLLSFIETNLWDKWEVAGLDNFYRSRSYMASHWARIGMELYEMTETTKYLTVFNNITHDGFPNEGNVPNERIGESIEGNSYYTTTNLLWDKDMSNAVNTIQDTNHASDQVQFLAEAYWLNTINTGVDYFYDAADLEGLKETYLNLMTSAPIADGRDMTEEIDGTGIQDVNDAGVMGWWMTGGWEPEILTFVNAELTDRTDVDPSATNYRRSNMIGALVLGLSINEDSNVYPKSLVPPNDTEPTLIRPSQYYKFRGVNGKIKIKTN